MVNYSSMLDAAEENDFEVADEVFPKCAYNI